MARKINLILLGAPGAGKGTQAELISEKFGIPAISTGQMIREEIASGSELGEKVKSYTSKGELVPDEVVINIIKGRLAKDDCKNGFILDGFPRTVPQAEALDSMGVEITDVISIEVPDEKIMDRMSGRRVCKKCGASYHVVNIPPKKEGICDVCGGELEQRKDDNEETAANRIEVYNKETKPLIDYYEKAGNIAHIDGTIGLENVFNTIVSVLGE